MTASGVVSLSGQVVGDLAGSRAFAFEYPLLTPVNQSNTYALASSQTLTLTVPTGATYCVLAPGSLVTAITLKGNAGDTGVALNAKASLLPVSTGTLVLVITVTGATTLEVVFV